jgi:3-mercaptopyruvate sulfurtransferase SseA
MPASVRVFALSSRGAPLRRAQELILMCADGLSSSFAALSLRELGFCRATDLVGDFSAWKAEELPVRPAPEPEAADKLPGMGAPEPLEADQKVAIADDIDLR